MKKISLKVSNLKNLFGLRILSLSGPTLEVFSQAYMIDHYLKNL